MTKVPLKSTFHVTRAATNLLPVLRKAREVSSAQEGAIPRQRWPEALSLAAEDAEIPQMQALQLSCDSFERLYRGVDFTTEEDARELWRDLCPIFWAMAAIEKGGYGNAAVTGWYQELRALPAIGDRHLLFKAFTEAVVTEEYLKAENVARCAFPGTYLERLCGGAPEMEDPHFVQWRLSLRFSAGGHVLGNWFRLGAPLIPEGSHIVSILDEVRWFNEVRAELDERVMAVCLYYKDTLVPLARLYPLARPVTA